MLHSACSYTFFVKYGKPEGEAIKVQILRIAAKTIKQVLRCPRDGGKCGMGTYQIRDRMEHL